MQTTRLAASAVVMAAMTLSACAAPQPHGSGVAYAAEFEAARKAASDPLIVAMLEDNKITDQEVAQSLELTVQCLRDSGLEANQENDGGFSVLLEGQDYDHVNEVVAQCESGRSALIQSLHDAMRVNPNNEDMAVLLMDCFKRAGLVDQSLTKQQWQSMEPTWDEDDPLVVACLDSPGTAHTK